MIQVATMQGGKWDKMNDSARRVYDEEGLAPTITTMGGGNLEPKVMERIKIPQATKSGSIEVEIGGAFDMSYPDSKTRRGRVQDGGKISPTIQSQSMEIGVVEPAVLTKERTEYGKAIRKDYDSGRVKEKRSNMTKWEPRKDGISNTLTCVQKDNMLCEPIALDEQNECLRMDGTVGTLTTDGSSPKHNNRVVEPFVRGSLQEHASERSDGICPTLTEAMGMGGGQVPVHNYGYRIRKLTPRECWRLMAFSDEDFDKAREVNSDAQLYKQAGNSICVNVLEEIFKKII